MSSSPWTVGRVDPATEHFVLASGDPFDGQRWTPLARIARNEDGGLVVEWLAAETGTARAEVTDELRWLFVDKREVDAWAYARCHTTTAANLYSPIHRTHRKGTRR